MIFNYIYFIHYLINLWKDKKDIIQALINFSTETNTIPLANANKLGIWIY